jgi:hypothetical protein
MAAFRAKAPFRYFRQTSERGRLQTSMHRETPTRQTNERTSSFACLYRLHWSHLQKILRGRWRRIEQEAEPLHERMPKASPELAYLQ